VPRQHFLATHFWRKQIILEVFCNFSPLFGWTLDISGVWVYFLRAAGLPKHPSWAGEYAPFSPKIDILRANTHVFGWRKIQKNFQTICFRRKL